MIHDTMQVYAAPVCFIFDLVGVKPATRETMISGLAQVLENEGIIKVMHDCAKPAAAIYYQLGIKLCNVFDTQVITAFSALSKSCTSGKATLQLLMKHQLNIMLCKLRRLQHVFWDVFCIHARFVLLHLVT